MLAKMYEPKTFEKNFKCDVYRNKYRNKRHLYTHIVTEYHMQYTNDSQIDYQTKKLVYKCTKYPRYYLNKSSLNRHCHQVQH